MIAIDCFTVGGILHRFPRLRVGFMEAGIGWLPFWLERLDEHWELMPDQAPSIDRKPSEYFLSGRCFMGVDPDEKGVAYVASALTDECIVYASDYCHWDCKFPDTVSILLERGDLSAQSKKRILKDNAARLYGLS
jgi:predicted TIM-barrel fold metal-dependent hydrolase